MNSYKKAQFGERSKEGRYGHKDLEWDRKKIVLSWKDLLCHRGWNMTHASGDDREMVEIMLEQAAIVFQGKHDDEMN